MMFRFYTSSLLFVFWNTCEGVLQVPSVLGYGGETTLVICTDTTITPGNNYFWLRNSYAIYSKSNEGTVQDGKYNGTTQTSQLSLQVLNTNITDAGQYQCNHNFNDAFGTVYVAYKPKRFIYTVSRGNVLQLSITAVAVYPSSATINSVICNGTTTETFNPSQTIVSNNKDTFLFDINWIGTTVNVSLTGDYVCTVNFMLIEPYITTLNVSFTAAENTEDHITFWRLCWCIDNSVQSDKCVLGTRCIVIVVITVLAILSIVGICVFIYIKVTDACGVNMHRLCSCKEADEQNTGVDHEKQIPLYQTTQPCNTIFSSRIDDNLPVHFRIKKSGSLHPLSIERSKEMKNNISRNLNLKTYGEETKKRFIWKRYICKRKCKQDVCKRYI